MKPETANWIATADYDLETARHMLRSGRYIYVLFMCHLAIEKMLKAHVSALSSDPPVKTHNLLYLIKSARLELPTDMLEFAGKINTASVPTRYPDDLSRMSVALDRGVAEGYLERTEILIQWLRSHANLQT